MTGKGEARLDEDTATIHGEIETRQDENNRREEKRREEMCWKRPDAEKTRNGNRRREE